MISPTLVKRMLICQRPWTHFSVIHIAQILLRDNWNALKNIINCHQIGLLQVFKLAYKEQKKAEIAAYGKNSYFKNL